MFECDTQCIMPDFIINIPQFKINNLKTIVEFNISCKSQIIQAESSWRCKVMAGEGRPQGVSESLGCRKSFRTKV